jgi:methionine-rich copper-binding protein CopC
MMPALPRRATLVAMLASVLLPRPADAHAILLDSTPPLGGKVKAGTIALRLRFNSRIDVERSRLTLIWPDKTANPLHIEADGAGDIFTAVATLRPGNYVLRWQVLAIDGHITRGDVPFTVTAG